MEFSIKYREEVREKNKITINSLNVEQYLKYISENFVKHGRRKNKNYFIQRYPYNDCKK